MMSDRRNIDGGFRALLAFALGCLAVVGLAACGGGVSGGASNEDVTVAEAEGEPSGDLTISNWTYYIDKETIPDYEKESGVSVKYVEDINSYEGFFSKMQPLLAEGESGGRSLMVAGDWLAKRMYDLGYIQKLDKEALAPAFENLSPEIQAPAEDPNWEYSIPWQGGMTGLIVNKEEAPDVTSINDLFDPKYAGKVMMVTELRETVPLVMKADGIDPAEATTQDWLDAIDKIDQAAEDGQIRRLAGGDYAGDLANGNAVAVIGWAADAIQLAADDPNLEWVMPEEGCVVWWDEWVIPAGAPNPTAAYDWINYAYEPENQAQIVAWTNSTTPVAGVKEVFEKTDPKLAKNPLIFPTEEYTENCSPVIDPPGSAEEKREVEEAWSQATLG